ncbi:unnamed protein product, partial [Brassica rapa subsp. narinosa]
DQSLVNFPVGFPGELPARFLDELPVRFLHELPAGFLVRLTSRSDCYRIGALGVLFLSFSNLRILCFYRYSRDLLCYLNLWLFIGFTILELTFEK